MLIGQTGAKTVRRLRQLGVTSPLHLDPAGYDVRDVAEDSTLFRGRH